MRLILFLLFLPVLLLSQQKKSEVFKLSTAEMTQLHAYLQSYDVPIRDTIFIKYDYNNETCWETLDRFDDLHIQKIVERFQDQVKDFNDRHPQAIAVNFREPGNRINKLKKMDATIKIDKNKVLKKLAFNRKETCGNSAVFLKDGSYLINYGDPHFELLHVIETDNKKVKF